jgi:hypothetical protein
MKRLVFGLFLLLCFFWLSPDINAQTPYHGSAFTLPGRLEAEYFDLGGQNVAYYDTDTINQGGTFRTNEAVDVGSTTDDGGVYAIGWFVAGEWLTYSIQVNVTTQYEIGLRVTNTAAGGGFQLLLNNQPLSSIISVPSTGSWSTYQTITTTQSIPAGKHFLTLKAAQNATNGFAGNINYLTFTATHPPPATDGDYDFIDLYETIRLFNRVAPFNYAGGTLIDIFDFNYIFKRINLPFPTKTPTNPPPTPTPTAQSPSPTPNSGNTVTVNMADEQGPVTYRGTGFIGPISDTKPPDSLILPLKPKLISWNRSYSGINRAMNNGMSYQLKLHNKSLIPSTADGDWSKWEKLVYDRAMEAKTKNYTGVEFDIWNEPEYGQYWDGSIDERYYQMWLRAYRTIKSVDPKFLVAGPSSTDYSWSRGAFFTRVKAENAVPDIFTFHELWSGGSGVANRVNDLRQFLANNGYPNWRISVNEYNDSGNARNPAVILRFLYEFELSKVHSAAKACWQEGGSWNCEVHLDNTLTYPDQQPRSVWHMYKAYADMTGTLVKVNPSQTTIGIASKEYASTTGRILIGNLSSPGPTTVIVDGLSASPFQNTSLPIKVAVYRIPNTDSSPLSAPIFQTQLSLTPQNNRISFTISNVSLNDVYNIVLSR